MIHLTAEATGSKIAIFWISLIHWLWCLYVLGVSENPIIVAVYLLLFFVLGLTIAIYSSIIMDFDS